MPVCLFLKGEVYTFGLEKTVCFLPGEMAEFMQVLRNYKFLSANFGVSSRKKRGGLSKWPCRVCKQQVRVDAVQGWSVGCLRSDVLSSQITSEAARLKLGAVKKADRTSVPEVIVVHEGCLPCAAVEACQELLRKLAPGQADRFDAAVSAKTTISLAVDSDDESICTEREFPE